MTAPIIIPEPQFCDADGEPYAGGTIETYVPGTSTPKTTWVDPGQTAANTNPVTLDSAGRCVLWGDGDYRLVLRDNIGNLIWDQPATTIVSAAMAPVVSAPTIDDAKALLGIDGSISGEATARANADATEQAARIAADNTLTTNLAHEVTRATAAETGLNTRVTALEGRPAPGLRWGAVTTGAGGTAPVTFSPPFSDAPAVTATEFAPNWGNEVTTSVSSPAGCTIYVTNSSGVGVPSTTVYWIAAGHN